MLCYHLLMILPFGFPSPAITNLSFPFIHKVKLEHFISDRFDDHVLELCFQWCKSLLSVRSPWKRQGTYCQHFKELPLLGYRGKQMPGCIVVICLTVSEVTVWKTWIGKRNMN